MYSHFTLTSSWSWILAILIGKWRELVTNELDTALSKKNVTSVITTANTIAIVVHCCSAMIAAKLEEKATLAETRLQIQWKSSKNSHENIQIELYKVTKTILFQ